MKTKHIFRSAIVIFLIGGVIYLQSAPGHSNEPFVVTFARYDSSTPTARETIVQLVNSRGKSLIKRMAPDGSELEHFVPRFPPGGWADRAAYLRSSYVIRAEQILGYTTYVFRQEVGEEVKEEWYAPETGPVPLKLRIERPDGSALVLEATKVEFREVSDEEVEPQPELMVHQK